MTTDSLLRRLKAKIPTYSPTRGRQGRIDLTFNHSSGTILMMELTLFLSNEGSFSRGTFSYPRLEAISSDYQSRAHPASALQATENNERETRTTD
jgi:hypothetical protein